MSKPASVELDLLLLFLLPLSGVVSVCAGFLQLRGTSLILEFVGGVCKEIKKMGLSNFPSAAEGVLPVLVMNTVLSVTLLKNMVRSVLQVVGASGNPPNVEEDVPDGFPDTETSARERRISITRFKSLRHSKSSGCSVSGRSRRFPIMECCVCLCRFEAEQEVSELSCKHFFHKGCLEKWFDNYNHNTCPLCRSMD